MTLHPRRARVCLIGLDCAAPELVYDKWRERLPNLDALMRGGQFGPLESIVPPITVPAWMCMMTGRDPGTLGIYGFRNRRDRDYEGLAIASSRQVRHETVWDVLGRHGKRSILIGIPLTYPPRPVLGELVSDFLAPNTVAAYTYPPELAAEIRDCVGDYVLDVRDYRTTEKARLLGQIRHMTERRFALAEHMATTRDWDFLAMVEMGPDRMHHAFWRYMDPEHRLHEPGSEFEHAIRDYYVELDARIGSLVAKLPEGTRILVVSDHGARRMDGAICINEWLRSEGYLALHEEPQRIGPLDPGQVDWRRTRAWGEGGYYGRVFLNVAGREPEGIVAPEGADALKEELSARLAALGDEEGRSIGTRVFRPEEVYREQNGIPPDLIVYFGDLAWRSVGSVGHGTFWLRENDTGPDDANHAQFGIAIRCRKGAAANAEGERVEDMSIYDVAPLVLSEFGIAAPPGMGRTASGNEDGSAYSEDEEAEIARRLGELGYL